jgi:hypothetical protein
MNSPCAIRHPQRMPGSSPGKVNVYLTLAGLDPAILFGTIEA